MCAHKRQLRRHTQSGVESSKRPSDLPPRDALPASASGNTTQVQPRAANAGASPGVEGGGPRSQLRSSHLAASSTRSVSSSPGTYPRSVGSSDSVPEVAGSSRSLVPWRRRAQAAAGSLAVPDMISEDSISSPGVRAAAQQVLMQVSSMDGGIDTAEGTGGRARSSHSKRSDGGADFFQRLKSIFSFRF